MTFSTWTPRHTITAAPDAASTGSSQREAHSWRASAPPLVLSGVAVHDLGEGVVLARTDHVWGNTEKLGGGVRPFFRAWVTVGLPPPKRVRSTASRVPQGGARPPYLGDRAAPGPAAWRWRWECSC